MLIFFTLFQTWKWQTLYEPSHYDNGGPYNNLTIELANLYSFHEIAIEGVQWHWKTECRAVSLDVNTTCVTAGTRITRLYLFPMKSNIKLCAKLENHIKSFTAEITRVHAGEESLRKPSNSSCDSVTNYFLIYINNQLRLVMNLRRAQTEQHSGILQHMEFHNSKIIKIIILKTQHFTS